MKHLKIYNHSKYHSHVPAGLNAKRMSTICLWFSKESLAVQ